jgi:5-methylcytosine-specific restriction endonuclease McrA
MAGEWIKVQCSTPDKPEVLRIARELCIDRDAVFGKLMLLWMWFDRNSVDGVVEGAVDADVDAVVRYAGFAECMRKVGWLKDTPNGPGLYIPNFDRHNNDSAKKRAQTNLRQARWRDGVKSKTSRLDQIPTEVRRHVMSRDERTCVYCGFVDGTQALAGDYVGAKITFDHVIPVTKGGDDSSQNLVACCSVCNRYKGNRTIAECGLEPKFASKECRREVSTFASTDASTREEKRRSNKTPLPPSGEFSRFWESWPKHPRKEAQGRCWEIWRKGGLDAHVEIIVAHVEAMKHGAWMKDGGAYIPAPKVYLNDRRWEGADLNAQRMTVDL